MKIIKQILNILLSFSLMIVIVATTGISIVSKITQKDYVLSKFEEYDVYLQIYNEIKDKFEEYIYQSGMEVDIINSICSYEKVKSDINLVIDSMYNGTEIHIDTSEIKSNLEIEINELIEKQNRKISKQEENNIKIFKDTIVKAYEDKIGLYIKTTDKVENHMQDISNMLQKLRKVAYIAFGALVILISVINIRKILDALNYISISLLSSGIILFMTKHLITSKFQIENILIISKSISNILVLFVKDILFKLVEYGKWYILFGCFGIAIISILKGTKKENKEN